MSWSYSPGLVAEFLEASCSDTEQYAPSNTTPMPDQFYWPDKPTEHSRISRFGMTCEPLTGSRGGELLTWYLAGFRVPTCQPPGQIAEPTENSKGLTGNTVDFGVNSAASLAKWNQNTHMWKIAQGCLFRGLEEFSGTWPKWGSMRDGECYQQAKSALPMSVNGSGYWLPTPTAHNAKEGNFPAERTRNTPTLGATLGGKINPEFTEWMMGWPTGHTDLKRLETAKCRSAKPQLGAYLEAHE